MSGRKNRGPSVTADLEEKFFKAADDGDEERVKECLDKGVDVNATSTSSWGRTALHMAAEGGHVHIAKLLIAKKAAVNTKDDTCETPLHIAASQGGYPMVQLLASTAGVDALAKNEDGKTALELSGTDQMIRRVLQKRQQDQRQSELMAKTGGVKMKRRIKVFVVGHGKVGKTTLIKALERILPLKELLKRDVTQPYVPTPGIEVEIVRIPGVGEASVWDFAGQTQFYVTHAMLLDAKNTIYIVNYKSTDEPNVQKGQVHQWLCSIKACNADPNNYPDVVLVASHGDMIRDKDGGRRRAENFLREMSGMFKTHLNIADEVIVMDCRKSKTSEMTQLKKCLHNLHGALLQKQQDMPMLCAEIIKRVPDWCKHKCSPKSPVMDWDTYRHAVKEFYPAVEENFIQKSTEHLHDQAEVILVRTGGSSSDSIVILKPSWLGKDVFGPTLAPENFPERLTRTAEDLVLKDEICRVFQGKSDPELVITLLQKFQLCHSYNGKEFIFPSLLTQEMPTDAWLSTGDPTTLYFGKAWRCRDLTDMFSSDFFPRVQTLLMTKMSNRPILWKGGAKCFDSDVEALVQMTGEGRTVYICTRSVEGDRERCHHMMHILEKLVVGVLQESSPGTDATQLILSARALKEHRDNLLKYAYTAEEVKVAKAESVSLVNRAGGYSEKVIDVMCKTSRHRGPSRVSDSVPIPGRDLRGISMTSSQSGSPTSIGVMGRDNVIVVAGAGASVNLSGAAGVSMSGSSAANDDSVAGSRDWQDEVFTAMTTDRQYAEPMSPTAQRTVVEGDENTVVTAGDGSFVSVRTSGDGQDMEPVAFT
ncbi:death-associated protein kinase 1-like isoform X1 [Branchiostoma lanceolatum]|uniref:death-associated protein kinase 1-like isoform X1 n=1 Tax=Branchiostoma lanceolatum TaxID=7740 RepID=UPI0034527E92